LSSAYPLYQAFVVSDSLFYLSAERQLEILNALKKLHLGMWMQAVINQVELIKYVDSDKSEQKW